MAEPNCSDADRQRLADMIAVRPDALWTAEELGAILQHQLDASLEFDLSRLEQDPARGAAAVTQFRGGAIHTFRQLLNHPQPPVELLELTRRFAKNCRSQPDGPVPDEVATVLYLAAIVSARLKCGRMISRLDETALKHALDWALEQPWLDPGVGELLGRARATLTSSEPNAHA